MKHTIHNTKGDNSTGHKTAGQDGHSRRAGNIMRLAAWSVLASGILRGPLLAVEATPAEAESPIATVAPVATTAPTSAPATVTQSADAPPVPQPVTPEPTTPRPAVPDASAPQPSVAPPKTPEAPMPSAPAPSAPKTLEAPATQSAGSDQASKNPTPLPPSESMISKGIGANGMIDLMVNKSTVLTTRSPYKRVSIGQPDIADVNLVGPSEVLLTAKKPGSTQLILWDDQDRSQVVDVVVRFDLRGLEVQMKEIFPKAHITIESANGTIVLRGHVPDLQTAQQVAAVAAPYGSSVLNFMEVSGGQQVVLQVRFAEVSRSLSQGLGFNAFATDGKFKAGLNQGPGASPPGSLATSGAVNVDSTVPIFGAAQAGSASFEFFISALRNNSLLRVLAEPNLTAISGQQASFLAGGEFPVPVPQAGGGGSTITISTSNMAFN